MKIKRIVKLTFQEDQVDTFLEIFEESKNKIRQMEGCEHLELWRGTTVNNILFTYSFWDSEDALNAYRHSELFKKTWAKTKVLFSDKPQAWSVEMLDIAHSFKKG